jgi:mono/diheme cytochrome c family protein
VRKLPILCAGILLSALASGCAPKSEAPARLDSKQAETQPTPAQGAVTQTKPPAAPSGAQAGAPVGANHAAEAQPGSAAAGLPIPALGYNAREGAAVYRHYCSTCHGDEGHGDGFNAYNLDPKPRDLGDPAFQSKKTDEDLVAVIRSGGGSAGLSTGMPPWGRTLSERKVLNVVEFLRTLPQKSESTR